jgi:hypothetical protein
MVTWDDGVQCDSGSGSATKAGCVAPDFVPMSMDYLTSGLKNPDGSPFRFTFFTRQLNTDMAIVENLYSLGHEIADHTISHAIDQKPDAVSYMHNLNKTGWERELLGQRQILTESTNIPATDILGFRSPDLSLNDDLFEVMQENKFLYDSSSTVILSGVKHVDRPWGTNQIWPFTLDHGIKGCPQGTDAGTRAKTIETRERERAHVSFTPYLDALASPNSKRFLHNPLDAHAPSLPSSSVSFSPRLHRKELPWPLGAAHQPDHHTSC